MSNTVKYKQTGLPWCAEIPVDWTVKKLKYLANVQPSNVDKKSLPNEPEVLLCNYVDVYKNEFITEEIDFMRATAKPEQIEKFRLKIGDVLITKDSESPDDIAVPALSRISKENLICGYHLAQISANPEYILGDYLFRLFQSKEFNSNFEIAANGITRYGLGIESIKSVFILLPPLSQQKAIAYYLDQKTAEIDNLISKKQSLIECLKEERMAIINQAVTKGINSDVEMKETGIEWLGEIPAHWEVKKLKYVAHLRDEKINDSSFKIAVENIESYSGRIVGIDEEKNFQGALSAFKIGDTIFNKLRPYLHKVYFAERDGGLYGELLVLSSTGELIPKFLYFKLFDKSFIDLVDGSTQGTKMPRANWEGFINQQIISFPISKDEQSQIVSYIEAHTKRIDSSITKLEQEIELIKEYRTALINEVVTGKKLLN